MFTCAECHEKVYGTNMERIHFSFSLGPCEWCQENKKCADCHCVASNRRSKRMDPIKIADEIRDKFRKKP